MTRVDTIWNGIKLTLIAVATVIFILALSFENADGMSSTSFHFIEPTLTDQNPVLGPAPTLQLNDGLNLPNNFDGTKYRPWVGGETYGEELDPPTSVVPEPTTMLLLGMGMAGVGLARRHKQAK